MCTFGPVMMAPKLLFKFCDVWHVAGPLLPTFWLTQWRPSVILWKEVVRQAADVHCDVNKARVLCCFQSQGAME